VHGFRRMQGQHRAVRNARLPMQCAVWGSACGGVSGVVHDVPLHGFVIGG
jgi:hypothetical protein